MGSGNDHYFVERSTWYSRVNTKLTVLLKPKWNPKGNTRQNHESFDRNLLVRVDGSIPVRCEVGGFATTLKPFFILAELRSCSHWFGNVRVSRSSRTPLNFVCEV